MTTATKLFFVCAVSELLLAVQALWQGAAERFYFCTIMAQLYVIAAGVWRNKP